jgi:hypothetical protein
MPKREVIKGYFVEFESHTTVKQLSLFQRKLLEFEETPAEAHSNVQTNN